MDEPHAKEAHATMPPPAKAYCIPPPGFVQRERHKTPLFRMEINILWIFATDFHACHMTVA
jgi:hypothetical protein